MPTQYTFDGTPVDILQRKAKRLRNQNSIPLTKAQKQVALEHGCESWQELLSETITLDKNDDEAVIYALDKKHGKHVVRHNLDVIGEDDIDRMDWDNPTLFAKFFAWNNRDHITFEVSYSCLPDQLGYIYPINLAHFCDNPNAALENFLDGLWEADSSHPNQSPKRLIQAMFNMGLWQMPAHELTWIGDPEGLLTAELWNDNLAVGDRLIFHRDGRLLRNPYASDDTPFVLAHELSDGRVVVSNGANDRHMLAWKILPRDEFDTLVLQMAKMFAIKNVYMLDFSTDKARDAESWFFNRVLKSGARRSEAFPREMLFTKDGEDMRGYEVIQEMGDRIMLES